MLIDASLQNKEGKEYEDSTIIYYIALAELLEESLKKIPKAGILYHSIFHILMESFHNHEEGKFKWLLNLCGLLNTLIKKSNMERGTPDENGAGYWEDSYTPPTKKSINANGACSSTRKEAFYLGESSTTFENEISSPRHPFRHIRKDSDCAIPREERDYIQSFLDNILSWVGIEADGIGNWEENYIKHKEYMDLEAIKRSKKETEDRIARLFEELRHSLHILMGSIEETLQESPNQETNGYIYDGEIEKETQKSSWFKQEKLTLKKLAFKTKMKDGPVEVISRMVTKKHKGKGLGSIPSSSIN